MQQPMRRVNLCMVCVLLLVLVFGAMPAQRAQAAGERWCPQETGFCSENAFFDYWRNVDAASNGHALEVLGYPIDAPRRAPNGQVIQFYERAVMEWHPENGVEYQVLLTRLGAVLVEGDARAQQTPDPCAGSCSLFGETNHTLRDPFRNYWVSNGGLPVFGFPLTEQVQERNAADGNTYTVQYFERNRYEYHPENAGTRYEVLLGRLGAELLAVIGGDVHSWPVVSVPDYGTPVSSPPPPAPSPPPSPPPSATPRPSPSPSPSAPPPASSPGAETFKSQAVKLIDQTLPALQKVLDLCPGANPLVCQSVYDQAGRQYSQMEFQTFDLANTIPLPTQCNDLYRRVLSLQGEGYKWLSAPYTPTRQGYIDRSDAVKRATEAGRWLLEARRVLLQEPGTCR